VTESTGKPDPETPLASEDFFWRDRCQHHWILPPADGPISVGVCKHCGAQREFSNNPEAVVRQPTPAPEAPLASPASP
jgi:hypothetical protein